MRAARVAAIAASLSRAVTRSAAVVALLVAWATALPAQTMGRVSYATRTLDGREVRVGAGEPATLVAVFATWCTSCRGEFATLDSLRRVLAPRGVHVLAVSVDEGDDIKVRRWAAARGTRLLVAHDGSGAVGRTFGTVGVPESYLVDRSGVVRWRGQGDIGGELGELGELGGLRRAVGELRSSTTGQH